MGSRWRGHGCDLPLAAGLSLFDRAVQLADAAELAPEHCYLFAVCLAGHRFTLRRHAQDHLVLLAVSTASGWEGPAVVGGRALIPFAPEDLLLRAHVIEDWPGAFTLRPPASLQPRQIETIVRSFPLLGCLLAPFLSPESQAALATANLEHNGRPRLPRLLSISLFIIITFTDILPARVAEVEAAAVAHALLPLPELARQHRAAWWLNPLIGVRRGPVEDLRVWLGLQDSLAWLRLVNKKRA